MLSKSKVKHAISRTAMIALVVVVIVIIAGGSYVAISLSSQSTNSSTSSVTTSASLVSSSSSSASTVSSAIISTTPYTIGSSNPTTSLGVVPLLVAEQQNLFTKYDPNAKLETFSSGSVGLQALASGTIQMLATVASTLIIGISNGDNITIVGNWWSPVPPSLWVVSASSNYTSPAQLEGKTLSTGPPSSQSYAFLSIYASQAGWGNLSQLPTVTVRTPTDQVTAVISGQVQGTLVAPFDYFPFLSTKLVKVIGNYSVAWPDLLIATTPSFAASHPNAVRAAMASIYGADAIFDANANNYTQNLLLNTFPATSLEGAQSIITTAQYATSSNLSLSQTQAEINGLYTNGVISRNLTATSILDPDFVTITK